MTYWGSLWEVLLDQSVWVHSLDLSSETSTSGFDHCPSCIVCPLTVEPVWRPATWKERSFFKKKWRFRKNALFFIFLIFPRFFCFLDLRDSRTCLQGCGEQRFFTPRAGPRGLTSWNFFVGICENEDVHKSKYWNQSHSSATKWILLKRCKIFDEVICVVNSEVIRVVHSNKVLLHQESRRVQNNLYHSLTESRRIFVTTLPWLPTFDLLVSSF